MNHKPFVTTELNPLPDAVQELIAERDEWKARCEFSFEQRDKLSKERDALKAENEKLHDLRHEREDVISGLKDAARLALDALEPYKSTILRIYTPQDRAIAALKAVL